MQTQTLTKKAIEELPIGADTKLWDETLKGLYLRVYPSGRKTWFLFYRNRGGEQRNYRLGDATVVDPKDARAQAKILLGRITCGDDPVATKHEQREAPSMARLWEEYLERHARPNKRKRSIAEDERNWRAHLAPRLAKKDVAAVSARDIDGFKAAMAGSPGAANRCLALLSTMMNLARRWGYRTDNPVEQCKRFPENQRDRYLAPSEVRSVLDALEEESDRGAVNAVKLMLLTGQRRGAVLGAKWDQLDLGEEVGLWTIPVENQKGRGRVLRVLRIALSKETTQLLRDWKVAAPRNAANLVFPSVVRPGQQRGDLQNFWQRVRTRAGVPDVRLHDLRHSFASIAVNAGVSLAVLGRSLGHRDVRTTQRYAHIAEANQQATAEIVSAAVLGRIAA
jgi:integrase